VKLFLATSGFNRIVFRNVIFVGLRKADVSSEKPEKAAAYATPP
jgi:hypothetical protein